MLRRLSEDKVQLMRDNMTLKGRLSMMQVICLCVSVSLCLCVCLSVCLCLFLCVHVSFQNETSSCQEEKEDLTRSMHSLRAFERFLKVKLVYVKSENAIRTR